MNRFWAAGILLKPKVLIAMALLYVTAFFCSALGALNPNQNLELFLEGLLAVIISVAGANALNCYFDRDIDGVMSRTQGRHIAIDTLGNVQTFIIGLSLLTVSVWLSIYLGAVPFFLLVIGAIFYLGIYTYLVKRRTFLNVLATFPSIAAPTLLGWYLGGSPIFPVGLVIAGLVSVWGPLHLWTLAFVFSKDYNNVNIPMLTSNLKPEKASRVIFLTLLIQVAASYLLLLSTKTSFYITGVSVINIIILFYGYEFYKSKSVYNAYRLFKLTAPYIIAILIILMIDQFL